MRVEKKVCAKKFASTLQSLFGLPVIKVWIDVAMWDRNVCMCVWDCVCDVG